MALYVDADFLADMVDDECVSRCVACGEYIDYCQGHGIIGDPGGYAVLMAHDEGDHSACDINACDDALTPTDWDAYTGPTFMEYDD